MRPLPTLAASSGRPGSSLHPRLRHAQQRRKASLDRQQLAHATGLHEVSVEVPIVAMLKRNGYSIRPSFQ